MYESKINEIKKIIWELYNSYLKSDNKKEYITKLGKLFNIPIFDVLAVNYKIVSIDIENLSIVIEDIRYGITYNASYTSNCDLFEFSGNVIRFIEVIEVDSEKYIKNVYHIGEDKPVISQMIFERDGQVLEFIKEESNDENTFLDNGKKLMIRYLEKDNEVYMPLLTRIEKRIGDDSFERIFTYDGVNYNSEGNLVDKSIYVVNNDMVYIIDDNISNTPIGYLKGICFENTHIDINRYKVNGINLDEFDELINKNTLSAIIFKGIFEDELCIYEIYKNNECINIKYYKHNNVIDNVENIEVHSENIELPILNSGKISVLEIDLIMNALKNDGFINIVINELNRFVKKICIKDRFIEEVYDPLSPRLLLDKDFEFIASVIEKNKDAYIKLISDEFRMISGLNNKKK